MASKRTPHPSLDAQVIANLSQTILEMNDPAVTSGQLFDLVATRCAKLIPNSNLWVACSDREERSITCYYGPWAQQAIDLAPAFGHHIESHPQFMALCQGISQPVDAVSDYIDLRKWRATGMFHEVIRPAGAIDQLSSSVPLGGNLSFSLVINRDYWGFTPEERTLLGLLTPHAAQAWRNKMVSEQQHSQASPTSPLRPDFSCRVFIDHHGNLVEAADPIIHWLRDSFGGTITFADALLPAPVRRWIRDVLSGLLREDRAVAAEEMTMDVTDLTGRKFRFTLVPGGGFGVHVLNIHACPAKPESAALRLATLGLSYRQAEVLHWVAQGKTNHEIAAILQISPFTVKAHLRSIFEILLVENRNAAASVAWRILRSGN